MGVRWAISLTSLERFGLLYCERLNIEPLSKPLPVDGERLNTWIFVIQKVYFLAIFSIAKCLLVVRFGFWDLRSCLVFGDCDRIWFVESAIAIAD
jgi:hypothetical protein